MTEEQRSLLVDIESMVRVLISKQERLNDELESVRAELLDVTEKLTESQKNVRSLEMENACLKTATAVSYTRDQAIKEKERLSILVKKIDKCISLLK